MNEGSEEFSLLEYRSFLLPSIIFPNYERTHTVSTIGWKDQRPRFYFIALMILLAIAIIGCEDKQSAIESISIDFPHGETRLLVERSGEVFLYYGALPSYQKVRSGTFDIEVLFEQLETRLHDNVPREEWPNPRATAGMVIIDYIDQSQEDYLIFDEQYAVQLFREARENILDKES